MSMLQQQAHRACNIVLVVSDNNNDDEGDNTNKRQIGTSVSHTCFDGRGKFSFKRASESNSTCCTLKNKLKKKLRFTRTHFHQTSEPASAVPPVDVPPTPPTSSLLPSYSSTYS